MVLIALMLGAAAATATAAAVTTSAAGTVYGGRQTVQAFSACAAMSALSKPVAHIVSNGAVAAVTAAGPCRRAAAFAAASHRVPAAVRLGLSGLAGCIGNALVWNAGAILGPAGTLAATDTGLSGEGIIPAAEQVPKAFV